MFFITEETKKTVVDFTQGTVKYCKRVIEQLNFY